MHNIVEDVSNLTTIPQSAIQKVMKKMDLCICYSVSESMQDPDNKICVVDIGIGELAIKHDPEGVKYHFTPSQHLDKLMKKTVTTKKVVLDEFLSDNLVKKFTMIYKDLC